MSDSFSLDSIVSRLVDFCHTLRSENIAVTPSETIDAAQCLLQVPIANKREFHDALKASLIKRPEEASLFDTLFDQFWGGSDAWFHSEQDMEAIRCRASRGAVDSRKSTERISDGSQEGQGQISPIGLVFNMLSRAKDNDTETGGKNVFALYSAIEMLGGRNFSNLKRDASVISLKRSLRKFSRGLATYPGRRFSVSTSGEVDIARSIRKSLSSSGEIAFIRRRKRRITKSRLVILCDISGSMDTYSDDVLRLLYYAYNTLRGTQVFGFSTRLEWLNKYLYAKSLRDATDSISHSVMIWSSGTRIGHAIGELCRRCPGVLTRKSVLLIISDGWEIGELGMLDRRLNDLKRRVAKIVWLNPLADSPGYEPITAGMKVAMPYLDIFSGLRIFEDRRIFERAMADNALLAAYPTNRSN